MAVDPSSQDDALDRAREGEAAAFASLVRAHQTRVYSIALRMLSDREQARDLAQEVFLQLYRKLHGIESARHLTFWLRKVTTHLAIDRLRQHPQARFAPLDEGIEMESAVAEEDPLLQRLLRGFLGELPPAPRAVMLLRYQEDLDPTEIADALDMPVNTVKSHLKRSLAFLKEKLLAAPNRQEEFP